MKRILVLSGTVTALMLSLFVPLRAQQMTSSAAGDEGLQADQRH